ncbi:MAG TPA: peptidoglycan DD-metalloendopeptidase family protein [Stellaceae bacterium]
MPGPERLFRRCLALIVAALPLCAPAQGADSPEQRLKSVERKLDESRAKEAELAKQADALAAELAGLRADSVAAAKAAQEHEAALSALDGQLATLTVDEQRKSEDLKRRGEQQAQLLMALERLARNPPEGLALAPGDPVDAIRSAMLMGAAVPPLEAEARALREEIAALTVLHQQIATAETRHRAERLALESQQSQLTALIARKNDLELVARHGAEVNSQRQVQLAAQAADLQQLIERLSAERQAREAEARKRAEEERQARLAEPHPRGPDGGAIEVTAPPPVLLDPSKPKIVRPFAEARGFMVYPASGQLMRRYGESDELGVTSKGLTFETRPAAQVVAPFDGRVLFAGPFRGYGQILIIEHGDGYHSLLAGLEGVQGGVGQWLVAGEPVGIMPRGNPKPHLYLELRHDGQPINPLPWLATREEKVSG